MKPTDFAYNLTKYLKNYLPGQCNVTPNTILSYRDTFKLLLRFSENVCGITPETLVLDMIDLEFVRRFLIWLEKDNNCSISTRNQRLAAIRAFFKYVQIENPARMLQAQQILSIKNKRSPNPTVNFLDIQTIKLLLSAPNPKEMYGLRDSVLLALLYDTGARVSEITALCPKDLRLNLPATVRIIGKGRKIRLCPISPVLAINLSEYMSLWGLLSEDKKDMPLFVSHEGNRIGRAGVAYILEKYAAFVRAEHPDIIPKSVTPHMLRHSKAMHMLEAGINLVYIRDQPGHSSIVTTEIYAKANPDLKRKAIAKASGQLPQTQSVPSWTLDNNLMDFLNSLGK
ncbi:MAG: site-specific integrase [Eubacterium sp.]|nr:site-specific integrase [Eubacterium sp.]